MVTWKTLNVEEKITELRTNFEHDLDKLRRQDNRVVIEKQLSRLRREDNIKTIRSIAKAPVNFPWEKSHLKEELDLLFEKEK